MNKKEQLLTEIPQQQLTKHPLGSLLEMWSISWPLMLGLLSSHLMIFVDRLFLARHSLEALNAGANASLAYYVFMVVPLAVCAISEVLVGKLQGENNYKKAGQSVWQMVWFSFLLAPIFACIAYYLPPFIFHGTGNEIRETSYFQVLIMFASFLCCSTAFNGFFIGSGQIKIVALCTLLANVLNMVIGYALILGCGPIPSLGPLGAGLAMGISQVFQALILLVFFLSKRNRNLYGTTILGWNFDCLIHSFKIGVPAGLAHFMEIAAHYLFFRILISAGNKCLTLVVLVQSFSMCIAFLIEAQSKGICAIVANLIGAKNYAPIKQVLKSALGLHSLFFALLICVLLFNPFSFLDLFLSKSEIHLLQDPVFRKSAFQAIIWMAIFFLFDGFSWILVGLLTAAEDTKFIFYVSTAIHWGVYLSAAYYFIGVGKQGGEVAWIITAFCSMLHFSIFWWRYRSPFWLKKETSAAIF